MTVRSHHLLLAAVALAACSEAPQTPAADANLYKVLREDLPITVKENGELQAVRETIVRSEVEGQATIIWLVPEGSTVKEGEKLVELDVSELVEKRASQEIAVEKAKSAWEQARTQADILEKELTTKRNTAFSQLRIAEMEFEKLLGSKPVANPTAGAQAAEGKNADMVKRLRELVANDAEAAANPNAEAGAAPRSTIAQVNPRNFADLPDKVVALLTVPSGEAAAQDDPLQRDMGEMANKVLQQVDQIRLAMADLKIKEDTVSYSRRLAKKQFITRSELERDELAYQSQLSKVTIAWNDLDLLVNYTLQTSRIKLGQDLENAKLELERVDASNDAERKKSATDVDAKHKELIVAQERLDNLNKQIKNGVIYAPTPGLVVYARVDRDRRGGEAIREGLQVRERQELIVLPDNSKMRCLVKVQEAQVDKVVRGQPALIGVEAFPNEMLTGKVTRVAPVADSSSSWMGNDKKVYTTVIDIDGENNDSRLRSRMAAAATITVATVPNTLTVPQQAVRRDRSVNYVWRQTAEGPKATPVKIGSHNQEKVELLGGVVEGDVVYRTPPPGLPDPKFDQPAPPAAPAAAPASGMPTEANAAPGRTLGNAEAPRAPGTGAPGTGALGGRQGRTPRKKFAEMTPEELADYKESRLPMMQGMVERFRSGGNEAGAKDFETALEGIKTALDKNDLEAAQAQADKIRTLMNSMMGGGRGPGGGGPGGGGPGGSGN